jgi:small subunit ribosomal protein S6
LAQNVYECMLIYNSNSYARDPAGVGGKIAKMVENCEGEVLVSRLWNEQRLAYPIKGHRKGTYWLTYFRVDSSKLIEFKRACRLEDDILRSLTLRVDPRLVETLVAHAKGEQLVARAGDESGDEAVDEDDETSGDEAGDDDAADIASEADGEGDEERAAAKARA